YCQDRREIECRRSPAAAHWPVRFSYPSAVKSLCVFTSQRPVLHQSSLFEHGQLGYENQQRSRKNTQRKHEQTEVAPDVVAELRSREQDARGDLAGDYRA